MAQYPLFMGKEKTSTNALTKTLDAEGKVRYDIIAKHGHSKDKVSSSKLTMFYYMIILYYYMTVLYYSDYTVLL